MRKTVPLLALVGASLVSAQPSLAATTATPIIQPAPVHVWSINQQRQELAWATKLQTQVRRLRHLALQREAQLGAVPEVAPVTTLSVPFLLWLRHAWRTRAATYAAQITQVAQAATQAVVPVSASGSGFPASCVAMAEESGHNSVAGYFGTISPPSAYNVPAVSMASTYGESWLNWPYSAQLQVAEQLFAEYGGGAWGPRTRQLCGI